MNKNPKQMTELERNAIQELARLQNPAYRHKRGLTPERLYAQEVARLKRQLYFRESLYDTHHDHNSAMRTYVPQLTGHKGKCKLNRARSMGRVAHFR